METDLFPANFMLDSEYSVIKSDIIKSLTVVVFCMIKERIRIHQKQRKYFKAACQSIKSGFFSKL